MKYSKFLFGVAAMVLLGCSKEAQEMVDQLEGYQWDVTDIRVNGKSVDVQTYIGGQATVYYYTYNSCDVGTGDCSGTFTYNEADSTGTLVEYTRTFTYNIDADGETYTETRVFEGDSSGCLSDCTTAFEIVKYREGKIFCFEGPDANGDEVLWTMEPPN